MIMCERVKKESDDNKKKRHGQYSDLLAPETRPRTTGVPIPNVTIFLAPKEIMYVLALFFRLKKTTDQKRHFVDGLTKKREC